MSPFRETVAIVAASITSELVVLAVFFAIRALWPMITPNVGALIDHTTAYLRGTPRHPGHYGIVAAWGVMMLIAATLGAYLATKPKVRHIGQILTGPYPHESTVSAWWILFERWPSHRDVEVVCMLDDGSAVRGRFASFNTSAEDSPDRDLILKRPIFYKPPVDNAQEIQYNVSAACLSARHIVTLFVAYNEPNDVNSSRLVEQTGPATQEQSGLWTPAASPVPLEASTSVAEPTLAPGMPSPRQESSVPSALRQFLRVLRFR